MRLQWPPEPMWPRHWPSHHRNWQPSQPVKKKQLPLSLRSALFYIYQLLIRLHYSTVYFYCNQMFLFICFVLYPPPTQSNSSTDEQSNSNALNMTYINIYWRQKRKKNLHLSHPLQKKRKKNSLRSDIGNQFGNGREHARGRRALLVVGKEEVRCRTRSAEKKRKLFSSSPRATFQTADFTSMVLCYPYLYRVAAVSIFLSLPHTHTNIYTHKHIHT